MNVSMHTKPSLICVDDERIVLDSLRSQLRELFGNSVRIEIAESGEEGLEIIEEIIQKEDEKPIVIISDQLMPGMKGDVFLEKAYGLLPNVKNILLTGQAGKNDVIKAVNSGNLYRYLPKPWDKEDLFLTIKEALEANRKEIEIREQRDQLLMLNTELELKVKERTEKVMQQKVELQELLVRLGNSNKVLEKENLLKHKLISIITHNVSGQVTFIERVSEALEIGFQQFPEDYVMKKLHTIKITTNELHQMINRIMEWVKSQRRELVAVKKRFDPSILIEEITNLYQGQLSEKKISLRMDVSDAMMETDEQMLTIILQNLIHNALKFTPEGGEIVISAQQEADNYSIQVKDSGVGISELRREQLMKGEAYHSASGTKGESGQGLGILIIRELLQKIEGELHIDSEPDSGSTFTIRI